MHPTPFTPSSSFPVLLRIPLWFVFYKSLLFLRVLCLQVFLELFTFCRYIAFEWKIIFYKEVYPLDMVICLVVFLDFNEHDENSNKSGKKKWTILLLLFCVNYSCKKSNLLNAGKETLRE